MITSFVYISFYFFRSDDDKPSNSRPDRDPNEEPPAKRFKEDDSPDSHESKFEKEMNE